MTLGEMIEAAAAIPAEMRASRRRAVVRRMQRMPSRQRERDLIDLGWREPEIGWGADRSLLPLVAYRDLGGEG